MPYVETLQTIQGNPIKMSATVFYDWCGNSPQIDVWGQLDGKGNPIRNFKQYLAHGKVLTFIQRAIDASFVKN